MVKLLFLCRRRRDITHDRYTDLLLDGHVPIALRHHPTLRQYVVNIVEESTAGAAPLDSVGELYFDTLADFRSRLYDSPEGERIVAADVAGFMGGATAYAVEDEILRPAPCDHPLGTRTAGAKLVVCLRRPAELPTADFETRWRAAARALLAAADRQIAGLTLDRVHEPLHPGAETWDGFETLHARGDGATVLRNHALNPDRSSFAASVAVYRVAEFVHKLA